MKKIVFIFIFSVSFLIVGCSEDTGSYPKGYKVTGLENDQVLNTKRYTIGSGCGPDTSCAAVIYSGSRASSNYVGIAISNTHTVSPPTFKILIYWNGSLSGSNESINLSPSEYNIKIWNGLNYYESISKAPTTVDYLNISLTVADGVPNGSVNSKIYTINFITAINVGYTISAGSIIVAHKY